MAFFTQERRIQLQAFMDAGISSAGQLAVLLGCCSRTVKRELARLACGYDSAQAQLHRAQCAARSAANVRLKAQGELLMQLYALFVDKRRYSPEQVSMALERSFSQQHLRLSTPAIYGWLAREQRAWPTACVYWTGRSGTRRSTRHGARSSKAHWAAQCQCISQRPEAANQRARHGDIECDTMIGRQRDSQRLLVSVERSSLYVRIRKVRANAPVLARCLSALLRNTLVRTLTSDRGGEFAALTQYFGDKLYVCHPYRADERGSCENTIRQLRDFFPKGSSVDALTDEQVAWAEHCLNHRPRKVLSGLAPIEALHLPPARLRTIRT